jgi:hypothetical protein
MLVISRPRVATVLYFDVPYFLSARRTHLLHKLLVSNLIHLHRELVAGACNAPELRCCSVIEEIELYDMDLFDLVVGALCKNEKKENPAGYNMMKVPHSTS